MEETVMSLIPGRRQILAGAISVMGASVAGHVHATESETWLNPPPKWQRAGNSLTITAAPKTDFWRKTYFGYLTDNGHLLARTVKGDFNATVRLSGTFAAQYDQAGLMVREDSSIWMKCGVEFVDNVLNVSSVFTRDYSDWAGVPLTQSHNALWIRLVRKGSSLTFAYSPDGKVYREVRQGYLTDTPDLLVGVMAAAPEGPGFEARFDDYTIVQG
jgi:uncharacterized protein